MQVFLSGPASQILELVVAGVGSYRDRAQLDWDITVISGRNYFWRAIEAARAAGDTTRFALIGFFTQRDRTAVQAIADQGPTVCVSLSEEPHDPAWWRIHADATAIARVAITHLQQVGYPHLAVWWPSARGAGACPRLEAVERAARAQGKTCTRLRADATTSMQAAEADLRRQIDDLPKPLGIVAHQDQVARFCLRFCANYGIAVPADVGVLGIDDDAAACLQSTPTLSSVRVPWRQIGEQAALACHRAATTAMPPEERYLPAFGVTARDSTAYRHSGDALIEAFLDALPRCAQLPQPVTVLAERLGVSRATLHRRVRRATGRSPAEHVHERRITRACELMTSADANLATIATAVGYGNAQRLSKMFTARMGLPPGAWRRR